MFKPMDRGKTRLNITTAKIVFWYYINSMILIDSEITTVF